MMLGIPTSALVVGALGAFFAGVQLYRRFADRRPFRTSPAAVALFSVICLVPGVVAGALSLVPSPWMAAVLGIGISLPFVAPNPTDDPPEGEDASRGLALVAGIWSVLGFMATALDRRLAIAKQTKVAQTAEKLLKLHAGDQYPAFERVYQILGDHNRYLKDPAVGDARLGRLCAVYEYAKFSDDPLTPLVALAYDWGVEREILRIASQDRARRRRRT